jgi:zinc D-Ala-D-Ala carboxypeptidase
MWVMGPKGAHVARHSRFSAQRTVRNNKRRYLTLTVLTLAAIALPSAEVLRNQTAEKNAANGEASAAADPAPGLFGTPRKGSNATAGGSGQAATKPASLPRDVEGLRKAAEAASQELATANRRWLEQGKRAKEAKAAAVAVRKEAGEAAIAAGRAREQLGIVAAAQYKSPDPGWALAIAEDPTLALRDAQVLDRIGSQQTARVEDLLAEQALAERLVQKATTLAKSADGEVAKLAAQRKALMRRANQIADGLTVALERLEEQRRASRAAERSKVPGCNPKDGYRSYPNGLIPSDALCPLPQDGHRLRADAAVAFWQMNDAFRRDFGRSICMSDSYRSLSMQRDLYVRKPGLAAVPGTSNHGWGLAVDLCGGADSFGTAVYQWLDEEGEEFGWDNPSWARPGGSRPEPWHWEYEAGVATLPS